jgi:regulator of sigma E protease
MINLIREIVAGAVVLGVLVLLHEWGHFIAAKLCGVRVDVFSIGFGQRIWGWKRGDTDYRVSWLPLGGYVRMAGDNPTEERTGASYEFLSRPRWQRFIIAIAGPTMNVLTTLVIFFGIFAFKGMPTDPSLKLASDVAAIPQKAGTTGVQPGDRILQINGANTPTWAEVETHLDAAKPGDSLAISVLRAGQQIVINAFVPSSQSPTDSVVGYPPQAAVIEEVEIGFPAERAGMKAGDKIVELNGKPVVTWYQLLDAVRNSDGRPLDFVVERDSKQIPMKITPAKGMDSADGNTVWQVGVVDHVEDAYEHQGPIQAARDSLEATGREGKQIFQVLAGLFNGKVSVHDLAGPLGIVRVSGQAAKRGPVTLLYLTAAISLNLGILNLLPIPILDGGHVLLLAIEGLMRRDLSISFKERFVQVGLVFLLGIFGFVMYSDILKVFQGH